MSVKTVTEPIYEFMCDECGVTIRTDGRTPEDWTSVTISSTGFYSSHQQYGSNQYLQLCQPCSEKLLSKLLPLVFADIEAV